MPTRSARAAPLRRPRDAEGAAGRLDALAQDLESARRAAIQPQLERLLAAEKQAAQLQERLRSVQQAVATGRSREGASPISPSFVDNLAPGEGPLRQAADKLATRPTRAMRGWPRNDKIQAGARRLLRPSVGYNEGLAR